MDLLVEKAAKAISRSRGLSSKKHMLVRYSNKGKFPVVKRFKINAKTTRDAELYLQQHLQRKYGSGATIHKVKHYHKK